MTFKDYRKESRALLRLFWPIILGQLAFTCMGVTDTVMSGAAGPIQLSGVAIGASFYFPCSFVVLGLTLAIQPIVAQLCGAGKKSEIAARMHVCTVVSLGAGLIMGLILWLLPEGFYLLDAEPAMLKVAKDYAHAVAFGMPAFALFNVLRSYSEGLGLTLPTMCFGFMSFLINIPLNYAFIFGLGPIPAFGGFGCGIATAITIWFAAAMLFLYVRKARCYREARLYERAYPVPLKEVKSFLKLGIPLALSSALEMTCFSLGSVILSVFGPVQVSAHAIALNVSGLFFMVPMALAMTATIRVGTAMGARDWEASTLTARTGYGLNFIFYVACVLLLYFGRFFIASLYTDDEEVMKLAAYILLLCSIYMFPDSIQMLSIGILRGFKDTRTIFYVTLTAYWVVAVPLGICFALGLGPFPCLMAPGIWIGFIGGLSTAAVIYALRCRGLYKYRRLPKAMQA